MLGRSAQPRKRRPADLHTRRDRVRHPPRKKKINLRDRYHHTLTLVPSSKTSSFISRAISSPALGGATEAIFSSRSYQGQSAELQDRSSSYRTKIPMRNRKGDALASALAPAGFCCRETHAPVTRGAAALPLCLLLWRLLACIFVGHVVGGTASVIAGAQYHRDRRISVRSALIATLQADLRADGDQATWGPVTNALRSASVAPPCRSHSPGDASSGRSP